MRALILSLLMSVLALSTSSAQYTMTLQQYQNYLYYCVSAYECQTDECRQAYPCYYNLLTPRDANYLAANASLLQTTVQPPSDITNMLIDDLLMNPPPNIIVGNVAPTGNLYYFDNQLLVISPELRASAPPPTVQTQVVPQIAPSSPMPPSGPMSNSRPATEGSYPRPYTESRPYAPSNPNPPSPEPPRLQPNGPAFAQPRPQTNAPERPERIEPRPPINRQSQPEEHVRHDHDHDEHGNAQRLQPNKNGNGAQPDHGRD